MGIFSDDFGEFVIAIIIKLIQTNNIDQLKQIDLIE